MRAFFVILAGQFVSLIGSGLSSFALGVWVFQKTGSITQFALIHLFALLPGLLISPLSGTLVDRWDRRRAMILADTGAGFSTLALGLLWVTGSLEVWHICAVLCFKSACEALQLLAYTSSAALLIPKRHLGRAASAIQLGDGAALTASPLIAGVLIGSIGVAGILLVDLATYLFALGTLSAVSIPRPPAMPESERGPRGWLREASLGWEYLRVRPGLTGLLAVYAVVNFSLGSFQILLTPMILRIATAETLGVVLSISSGGVLAGSLAMALWGGPGRHRVRSVLIFTFLEGLLLCVLALGKGVAFIAACTFAVFFLTPFINACSQPVWQLKVAPALQGRVFAMRQLISGLTMPLAYLLAGPLTERVLGPLLLPGGLLDPILAPWLGEGASREIPLYFILTGALAAAGAVGGHLFPRLRRLEDELPDQLP